MSSNTPTHTESGPFLELPINNIRMCLDFEETKVPKEKPLYAHIDQATYTQKEQVKF